MSTARKLGWLAGMLLLMPSTAAGAGIDIGPCAGRCSQSTLEVASVTAPSGAVVNVPVYLRDSTDTPLGPERARDAQIDGIALRIRFVPVTPIVAARFLSSAEQRLPPARLEVAPRTADGISYLVVRPCGSGLARDLCFSASTSTPQPIAVLELTLARRLPSGSRIELTLDPAVSVLSNAAGTLSESVANGFLVLRNGVVEVE
jgi:hypothetical protein